MKKILITLIVFSSAVSASESNIEKNKDLVADSPIEMPDIDLLANRDDNCIVPKKDFKKPEISELDKKDDKKVEDYNKKVDNYNKMAKIFKEDAKKYLSCVENYVKENEKKLEEIKEKTEFVINEANNFIKENKK